jgi:hypothetical protein
MPNRPESHHHGDQRYSRAVSPPRWVRRSLERDDWDAAERERWLGEPLEGVSEELRDLAMDVADQAFRTRDALNIRLSGTATFAGALLAVALTQGKNAGEAKLPPAADIALAIAFVGAVSLLVAGIVIALSALRPGRVTLTNPDVLRYYGRKGTSEEEMRIDQFRLQITSLYELRAGNARRSARLTWAQFLVGGALSLAAAGAVVLFFAT